MGMIEFLKPPHWKNLIKARPDSMDSYQPRGKGAVRQSKGVQPMIRNLRVLLAAAMALMAFGALASAAQASKFTAPGVGAGGETTISAIPDETVGTKTAHHVFDITNPLNPLEVLSITCNEFTGDTVIKGESTEEVTVTPHWGKTVAGVFKTECNFAGQEVEVSTGACQLKFTASGLVHIEKHPGVAGECKHGKQPITFKTPAPNECHVEVAEQTIEGVKYHPGPERGNPKRPTITLEANNLALVANATGPLCPWGTSKLGTFTTGNTIITGATLGGTSEASMREIKWDA